MNHSALPRLPPGSHTGEGRARPGPHSAAPCPAGKGRPPAPVATPRHRHPGTAVLCSTPLPRRLPPAAPPVTPPSRPRPLRPPGRNRAPYKSAAPAGPAATRRREAPRRRRLRPAGPGGETGNFPGRRQVEEPRPLPPAAVLSCPVPSRLGRRLRLDLPTAQLAPPGSSRPPLRAPADAPAAAPRARGPPRLPPSALLRLFSAASRGERREMGGSFPWRRGSSWEVSE